MQYQNEPKTGITGRLFIVIVAGIAGGVMEMLWVMLYSSLGGAGAAEVARQITATVLPSMASANAAPALGIGIHFLLSVMLAAGFIMLCLRPVSQRYGPAGIVFASVAVLAAVWAMNFLVLLPALNPAFVALLPYTVTCASKLLFGLAMAGVLVGTELKHQRMISQPSM